MQAGDQVPKLDLQTNDPQGGMKMIGWRVDRGLWNELDRIQRGMDELFTALAGIA